MFIADSKGRERIIGIVSRYGVDGWGLNSGGSKVLSPLDTRPDGPWVPPCLLYSVWPGRGFYLAPHLAPRLRLSRAIDLPILVLYSVWHVVGRP